MELREKMVNTVIELCKKWDDYHFEMDDPCLEENIRSLSDDELINALMSVMELWIEEKLEMESYKAQQSNDSDDTEWDNAE